ncbi:MAG: signal peptidase I [Candidatus Woesearchaeota archaeon]
MFGRKKKLKPRPTTLWGKSWYFIWEDNSVWSWLVNIVLAFVLIKFVVYPALGFMLSTSHPVVAVVSNSMQHSTGDFDKWWTESGNFYEQYGITKDDFRKFTMSRGFSKGDIIILKGAKPQSLKAGSIIVFFGSAPDPIIHRVVERWEEDGQIYFRTKGDNNEGFVSDEIRINQSLVVGKAWFKLPLLGYVKIIFAEMVRFIRGVG